MHELMLHLVLHAIQVNPYLDRQLPLEIYHKSDLSQSTSNYLEGSMNCYQNTPPAQKSREPCTELQEIDELTLPHVPPFDYGNGPILKCGRLMIG